MIWIAAVLALAVAGFAAWWFWPQSECKHDCSDPRYLADRRDPLRAWIHGVLAVYRGDVGDPGYWDQPCAERQANGWGMKTPADMHGMLARYRDGEINTAFDKVRIIWLARLGQALGWLTEAQSWEWCRLAAGALQQQYASWQLLYEDIDQGRIRWYDGKVPEGERERAMQHYQFANANVVGNRAFR
jgi:hypothetical protein